MRYWIIDSPRFQDIVRVRANQAESITLTAVLDTLRAKHALDSAVEIAADEFDAYGGKELSVADLARRAN